jgi:hypothetical protein
MARILEKGSLSLFRFKTQAINLSVFICVYLRMFFLVFLLIRVLKILDRHEEKNYREILCI